jgi:hypothetical protein
MISRKTTVKDGHKAGEGKRIRNLHYRFIQVLEYE